jgi:hypothetical protein
MIRPASFGFNSETYSSNPFQKRIDFLSEEQIQEIALLEFDNFTNILKANNIKVTVFEDTISPKKPDAIFPNNWIAILPSKEVITFPMATKSRAIERRDEILIEFKKRGYSIFRDLEKFEKEKKYLEGTGSIVLDHKSKTAYAAISERTSVEVLNFFCSKFGYTPISFNTVQFENNPPIYHTNIILTIGKDFAMIGADLIIEKDREKVLQSLSSSGKEIIKLTYSQITNSYLGNALLVRNSENVLHLIMSSTAYRGLSSKQKEALLQKQLKIIKVPINIIETVGGGSARCMLTEIY